MRQMEMKDNKRFSHMFWNLIKSFLIPSLEIGRSGIKRYSYHQREGLW